MSYFSSGRYQLQNGGQAWSYAASGDTMRFEVHSGDQQGSDPSSKERSEIRDLDRLEYNQTYSISYSFMVEPGAANSAKWLMISQLHQSEDAGESGFAPVFDIALRGERLAINVRSSTEQVMTSDPVGKTVFLDSANIVRGAWYDIKLEVRIDPFGQGLVNAWRNDVQIAHYEGAVGYNDARGPYWKMGVYRAEASESFAVGFKGLDIAAVTSDRAAASVASTVATAAGDVLSGQSLGGDTIRGLAGDDTIIGETGADNLQGDEGQDNITGGGGADFLHGNPGSDTVSGGAGNDIVLGGKDDDLLQGDDGDDYLHGNLGADTVFGGVGSDTILGGQANDSLSGGEGGDWMSADRGDDTLSGGRGADTFNLNAGGGVDRVLDFSVAEGDRVHLEANARYSVYQTGGDAVVDLGGGDMIVLMGVDVSSLASGSILLG